MQIKFETFFIRSMMLILIVCVTNLYANPVIPINAQAPSPSFVPASPNINANGYILLDATSGKVLAEKNADIHIPPASLTKLMSLYIISTAIKNGQIRYFSAFFIPLFFSILCKIYLSSFYGGQL